MDARQYAALPDPFPMWRGGKLHGARIAFETWGELNAARQRAAAFHRTVPPGARCLSAEPRRWLMAGVVGLKLALDTERYFVICVNSLGSCFGSSGPASTDPATGEAYRLTFPDLLVEDIARGGSRVTRSRVSSDSIR